MKARSPRLTKVLAEIQALTGGEEPETIQFLWSGEHFPGKIALPYPEFLAVLGHLRVGCTFGDIYGGHDKLDEETMAQALREAKEMAELITRARACILAYENNHK